MIMRHDFSPQNAHGMLGPQHPMMGGQMGGSHDHNDKAGVIGLNLVPSDFSHGTPFGSMQGHGMKSSYFMPSKRASPTKISAPRAGSPTQPITEDKSKPSETSSNNNSNDNRSEMSQVISKPPATSDAKIVEEISKPPSKIDSNTSEKVNEETIEEVPLGTDDGVDSCEGGPNKRQKVTV
jgi:hypothetical protein